MDLRRLAVAHSDAGVALGDGVVELRPGALALPPGLVQGVAGRVDPRLQVGDLGAVRLAQVVGGGEPGELHLVQRDHLRLDGLELQGLCVQLRAPVGVQRAALAERALARRLGLLGARLGRRQLLRLPRMRLLQQLVRVAQRFQRLVRRLQHAAQLALHIVGQSGPLPGATLKPLAHCWAFTNVMHHTHRRRNGRAFRR